MTPHPGPARLRRCGAGLAATAFAVCGLLFPSGSPAHAAPAQSGPTGAEPSGGSSSTVVECLDQRLRPSATCPAVDAEVTVALDGDDLLVSVANAGEDAWPGGPIAVEFPVRDADVDEPEGRADPTGRPGTPEWTTRAGTVVSRCVFEPVAQLRSGSEVTCRLHRLGLPDGTHQLWLTGFVGGLPAARGTLGDTPPVVGVVAAATPRSVGFRIDGDQASVIEVAASTGPTGAPAAPVSSPSDRTARLPWVLAGTVAIGIGTGWYLRRRRSS